MTRSREVICGHLMRRYETPRRGGVPDYLRCGRRPGHPGRHQSTLALRARKLSQAPSGSPEVASAIREARERLRLSQRRLAVVVGVTDVCVGLWERAERTPSAEVWVQLELALGPLGVIREADPRPVVVDGQQGERAA
jgi:DNA-binding XRE family transcriptional regulator